MQYSQAFKNNMVRKMTGRHAVSANTLSKEVGVSQSSLSKWLREAGKLGAMKNENSSPKQSKSPREWTFTEKLAAVTQAAKLSNDELGTFLRREGLHEAQLRQWIDAVQAALSDMKPKSSKKARADAKRIRKLEKELDRKDKALAEVTALLVLKKKLDALLGGEDNNTHQT